jgi:hypothetical protein
MSTDGRMPPGVAALLERRRPAPSRTVRASVDELTL